MRSFCERKIPVVACIVLGHERPIAQPGRGIARTSKCPLYLLVTVPQRDLRVPKRLGRSRELPLEQARAEGILGSDRYGGPPTIFGNEPDLEAGALVFVGSIARTEAAS